MIDQRIRFSAEEKVSILHRHLLDQAPLSKLCEELNLKLEAARTLRKEQRKQSLNF